MAAVVVYAIDAGSVARGNFAWTSSQDRSKWSASVEELAASAVQALQAGKKIAIGIECVLFLPVPETAQHLGKARAGECTPETKNRPFSAGAAASATMTGIPGLAWVLRQIREACPVARGSTRWEEWQSGAADLLLWEAFVTGTEKASPPSHYGDALLALEAFQRGAEAGCPPTRVTCGSSMSLAGAALLWAGLSSDLSLLHHQALVLRPLPRSA